MSRAPYLDFQLDDIQAPIGTGFGWLESSRFWLLTVGDSTAARDWLVALRESGLLRSVDDLRKLGHDASNRVNEAAAVAFSFAGLHALGLEESEAFPFPTPFRSGMGSALREALLRDVDRSGWRWRDVDANGDAAVHVLVMSWWKTERAARLPQPRAPAFSRVLTINGCPSFFRSHPETGPAVSRRLYEPFGFRDGLAQPVLWGLREDTDAAAAGAKEEAGPFYSDRVVAQGEFILGYRNEYDELSYVPDVRGWTQSGLANHQGAKFGFNASYLALRQIEQDRRAFLQLEADAGGPRFAGGVTIGEKMIGRRRDGRPLTRGAVAPGGAGVTLSDSKADAFRFRVEDAQGFFCPLGSHIRRAHPRDALGHEVQAGIASSKLHRLIRRGRPYREGAGDDARQGLVFIACNADLERQFEFVLQRWLHNPQFADLDSEDDPILGCAPVPRGFSVPPGSRSTLSRLTSTLGGGYFLLPGLKALQFIVRARPG